MNSPRRWLLMIYAGFYLQGILFHCPAIGSWSAVALHAWILLFHCGCFPVKVFFMLIINSAEVWWDIFDLWVKKWTSNKCCIPLLYRHALKLTTIFMTALNAFQSPVSGLLRISSNLLPFNGCLICEPTNLYTFDLVSLIFGNFSFR